MGSWHNPNIGSWHQGQSDNKVAENPFNLIGTIFMTRQIFTIGNTEIKSERDPKIDAILASSHH